MSSMFKKKGGPAFKPKIPSARPRQPGPAASQRAKAIDNQTIPETPPEDTPRDILEPPRTEEPSGGAASSEPTQEASSKAGQALPTPAPTQHALTEPPETIVETESSKEPPVEKLPEEAAVANESAGAASNAGQSGPVPTVLEREPQPPIIAASTEADTDETPETVEESVSADAAVAEAVEEATPQSNEVPASAPAAPVRKTRSKRASTSRAKDSTEDDSAAARPIKRQRRAPQNEGEESEATPQRPRRREPSNGETRPRRTRSVTPEDAESQVVDLQKLKMSDLTRDLHIGKKFSRHDELRDRERQARMKAKLKTDGEQGDEEEGDPDSQTSGQSSGTGQAASSNTPNAPAASSGPQFRIVDGQIVVDQSSLVMDRHARAAATQADMETIEENDFTRLITSSSFMNTSKLKGPNIWTPEETELFYRGLSMFGTDFEMISKMFAGKQRRHIKLKYNREERHNPRLIDAALIGEKTIKMDIDEYKALTSSEFESVESIEAEQRRIQEDFEAERKRIADEQAEAMRKKREELFADDDGKEGGNGKKKKKGKKKGKNADSADYGELVAVE